MLVAGVRFPYGLLSRNIFEEKAGNGKSKSSKKRTRQDDTKRLLNKYYARIMRNALRRLRKTTNKETAVAGLSKVTSMIEKYYSFK
ncbi:MAG: 30S ribosomal protein S20 [Mangrovibacterium sp.]